MLPTQSGSSCAYKSLGLEFTGALTGVASVCTVCMNHRTQLLQTRCWGRSWFPLLRRSRPPVQHVSSRHPHQGGRNRTQEQVLIYSARFLFQQPLNVLSAGTTEARFMTAPRYKVKRTQFFLSYILLGRWEVGGRTVLWLLVQCPMGHGMHLNIIVRELRRPSSYTEQTFTTISSNIPHHLVCFTILLYLVVKILGKK